MRLKSFHARSMADAMRQVRDTLGDDAIIVATREEEGGGVRVTAAVEADKHPSEPTRVNNASRPPARPEMEMDAEVDVGEIVADALHRHGVPAVLAEQLIDAAAGLDTNDPTLALGAALDAVFTFHPLPESGRAAVRPLVLVGPPGSGKTLTVAKLAARAVLKNRTVSVISTDTVRAGGIDQLAAFTRLLKVKLHRAENPEVLSDAIADSRGNDLVVIDTAGSNPFDTQEMGDLRALLSAGDVEPILVLPAGMDMVEAAETGLVFKTMGAKRLLVTRLDVARRFGSVLAAAHRARLIFCDGTVAAKVAEGLTPLNPVSFARLMMPTAEKPNALKMPPNRGKNKEPKAVNAVSSSRTAQ